MAASREGTASGTAAVAKEESRLPAGAAATRLPVKSLPCDWKRAGSEFIRKQAVAKIATAWFDCLMAARSECSLEI